MSGRGVWIFLALSACLVCAPAATQAQTALPAILPTPFPGGSPPVRSPWQPVILIDSSTVRHILATPTPRPKPKHKQGNTIKMKPAPSPTYEIFSTLRN